MKVLLGLLLLLTFAPLAYPDDLQDEARAAIAAAQASQPERWLSYADGYWKAKRENKPLVVFVGAPVMDVPGAVCCEGDHEEWGPHATVVVCHKGVATVHSEFSPQAGVGPIRSAVRALLTTPTVRQQQATNRAVQMQMQRMQSQPQMRMQHSNTMRAAPMRMSVRSGGACAG